MTNKKVLVIGDSCQDIFIYGKCERLSPEAPVPVLNPSDTIGSGGMTINVFENLKALGVKCDIITNDVRPVKTRYVDEVSNQMLLRVDEDDTIRPISSDILNDINYYGYDAIIISDYNKGFLSERVIQIISEKHPLVFMDTKKRIGDWANKVRVIKINDKEYLENEEYLNLFTNSYDLVVTRGKHGAILNNTFSYDIENKHEVRDLSGAGDTFLASLVADYINNNDICKSIQFANKCAAWVVSQKGVAIVNPEKI